MDKIKQLAAWIEESHSTVFFGGAGTSTESNVPDFRSEDGLYKIDFQGIRPEEVLSRDFYFDHTDLFYKFLKTYLLKSDIQPHKGHHALVSLEREGMLDAIITQNIDGLHQMAGSKNVFELHGTLAKYHCINCRTPYTATILSEQSSLVPTCPKCGGNLKPDVVLYQEGLDDHVVSGAIKAIAGADLLIVCGTSLVVYPAAGFLQYYRGKRLVLINRDETPYDGRADLVIRAPFGEVFGSLVRRTT
ncbi:NAD-dependent protein deacylase [Fusibacter paucivorans]|uniref:NAD-dependent protein deacetylase n=1 Tax=Fusibacter paucivorans TaxID=76009 RepID=A0ABS5PNL4_9FIRM|nr:NAD-dependent protein deacylase [Fusibacter paucivorans]MBS7526477.1 NAD-dependent protein deacylase [Fusibacter paucivorans]